MSQISVLMPVYNAEKYLKECLDSLINQTFKDFEVIMVNDGSTDSSGKICDEYSKLDKRFKTIHQKNQGCGVARNVAIDYAMRNKDGYIAWVDADDIVSPEYLNKLYYHAKRSNCDIVQCEHYSFKNLEVDVSNFNSDDIDENNNKIISGLDAETYLCDSKYGMVFSVLWNKLYKKRLFEDCRVNINENFSGRIHNDEDMLWRLYLKADKILMFEDKLYGYRIVDGSIQHSKIKNSSLETFEIWLNRWKYYNDNNLEDLKLLTSERILFIMATTISREKDRYINYKEYYNNAYKKYKYLCEIIDFKCNRIDLKFLNLLGKRWFGFFKIYGKTYYFLKKFKH